MDSALTILVVIIKRSSFVFFPVGPCMWQKVDDGDICCNSSMQELELNTRTQS